jgi:hypothetical protein
VTRKFSYKVRGTAADDQTWEAKGEVTVNEVDIFIPFNMVMRDTFAQLTGGRAVYGKPGVGCAGPYEVTSFSMERA